MARAFSSREVKEITDDHFSLMNDMVKAVDSGHRLKNEVDYAINLISAGEIAKLLREIPIDEVNRDKKGIRVKVLKDSGYETMADIFNMSVHQLEEINGIGPESARVIKAVSDDVTSKLKKNVRIKLSLDDKNPKSTRLVKAVAEYNAKMPYINECHEVLKKNKPNIDAAISDLSVASSGLKWIFSSGARREQAESAYVFLVNSLRGDYGRRSIAALKGLIGVGQFNEERAWDEFSRNPIAFFNTLEKIVPGYAGDAEGEYGLPEYLAKEVLAEPILSEGLKCQLRRYQELGVKYVLHQQRVLLGDEMGLGKTVQAIASMVSRRNSGDTHFMVVCPASVLTNWCREITKMSDLSVVKLHGDAREQALGEWMNSGGVAVTTYETTGSINLPGDFKMGMLVVDEAHYIKNPEAKRTVNVKNISKHADRVLFMTGTALENKVDEMVALIKILQPKVAGSVAGMTFMSAANAFKEKIAPVYFRRKRDDVLKELPELTEIKEWCTLLPEEEAVYEEAVLSKDFSQARRVSWNVEPELSSKAQRLKEIVEEAADDGRKIIVFSFFLDTIAKVAGMFGDKCLSPITGSVAPKRRQEIIDEFDRADAGAVLAAQIQSGGTGLNIQSASVVVICEPQFKPSIENQAIARAYRMGQTRNVIVYRLLSDETVDERITDLLENKQAIFDAFADESVAAGESMELDEKGFGSIIEAEIERINKKKESA